MIMSITCKADGAYDINWDGGNDVKEDLYIVIEALHDIYDDLVAKSPDIRANILTVDFKNLRKEDLIN